MSDNDSIFDAINFAKKVLKAKPGEVCNVKHDHNYFTKKPRISKANQEPRLGLKPPPAELAPKGHFPDVKEEPKDLEARVIYVGPGQARAVQIKHQEEDVRAGANSNHNSPGEYFPGIETIEPLKLEALSSYHTAESLDKYGFTKRKASITKKRIFKMQNQFSHLSKECFEDMMCLDFDGQQRDFEVWTKVEKYGEHFPEQKTKAEEENYQETAMAFINPKLGFIQYMQFITRNELAEIVDLKHVVFETGIPLVVNQSKLDHNGNVRNIAHVGVTGSKVNSFYSSLERYDDGTVLWTTADYKKGQHLVGTATLYADGRVELFEGGDKFMTEFSARNLGAEGINPRTLNWTGKYAKNACIPEAQDKYILRREYKTKVRKQVWQIVDGACIPGLDPIFNV